ncbi:MAG: hypothetical protein NUV86_02430 [Candidatus Scalindua sp.]|nr:hypothetical protein [Candidatus Scalindua sp.]
MKGGRRTKMTTNNYMHFVKSLLLQDKKLRTFACDTVDYFLKNYMPVKNTQLNSIPSIIQGAGLDGLKKLIDQQKSKNTNKRNKMFWEFMHQLINEESETTISLRKFVIDELRDKTDDSGKPALDNESDYSEKREKKRVKNENKKRVDTVITELIKPFFEHFNCDYSYKTIGEGSIKK